MAIHKTLDGAKKELFDRMSKITIAAGIQMFNNIIIETPVDTGRARGNWQASINQPIYTELTSAASISRQENIAQHFVNYKVTDTAYLTNNLSYIESLEYGSSDQRPNGWVRYNVNKAQAALDDAIRKEGGNV